MTFFLPHFSWKIEGNKSGGLILHVAKDMASPSWVYSEATMVSVHRGDKGFCAVCMTSKVDHYEENGIIYAFFWREAPNNFFLPFGRGVRS